MKKISLIISLIFTSVTGILTSCSEDYPGPDPVDVTANYSNKFSNPNPTLTLVYNGENMTGKSVDFSTVKGETANLTFYDILPGEKALKLTHIPLTGDAEGYSFQGKGIGTTTQSTFNYEGRVVKGRLILNLADVTMANANLWAKNYRFADVEHGTGKVIADEGNGYQWEEKDDKMTSCAIYFRFPETEEATETSYNGQNMGSVLQGLLGYLLPCILKDITLEPDGNIIANYSGDAFNEEKGAFLKAWLQIGWRNKKTYIDAFLNTTAAFWYPDTEEEYLDFVCFNIQKDDPNYPHVEMRPVSQAFYRYYTAIGSEAAFRKIPVIRQLLSMGLYFWLMVAAALYVIYRKEYMRLLWMLPFWTYMGTSLLGPAALIRYSYPVMLGAPILLYFCVKRKRTGA